MSTILLTRGLSVRQVLNGFVASARGILFSLSLSLSSIVLGAARSRWTTRRSLFVDACSIPTRRHRDEPRDLERKNTINAGETAH